MICLVCFNTSTASKMIKMFSNCYKLNVLNLSSFDISSVNDMTEMLVNSSNLNLLILQINLL